jgi:CRP/FNR family cyclic AMP-dependent transcriptional regulator
VDSLASSQPPDAGNPSPETTQSGVRRAFLRSVKAGQVLFEIGDPGEPLFVVQAGEVALLEPGPGGAPRLLARLGPGDPVGETDAVLGRARTVRAVAATDGRLLQLDRETFREMCLARPEIALRIVERLAQRTADLEQRLGALGMNDLVRPVARSLARHLPGGGASEVRLSLTLRAIAECAGLSLRDAHRGLSELFDRKLVRLVEDALIVSDPRELLASLEGDGDSTGSGAAR